MFVRFIFEYVVRFLVKSLLNKHTKIVGPFLTYSIYKKYTTAVIIRLIILFLGILLYPRERNPERSKYERALCTVL
jgi:hypothetical protein